VQASPCRIIFGWELQTTEILQHLHAQLALMRNWRLKRLAGEAKADQPEEGLAKSDGAAAGGSLRKN